MNKHTLSVLVENKPGVLARVSGLFSRRGFNIDSLAVGETENPDVSRITIVVNADSSPLEQVTKQLNKLVNVLKIVELDPAQSVQRELLLVKVRAVPEVCCIYCATANPTQVIVAQTELGRGVLGVVDGASPLGVETDADSAWRKDLLRQIGYKL